MNWGLRSLLLIALLAGCTQPVPPGAQVTVLYPPDGVMVDPNPALLVAAQAWGPGFLASFFGGDVGIDKYSGPLFGIPLVIKVDGKLVRKLSGASLYRVRLAGLTEGPLEITVYGIGMRKRVVLQVLKRLPVHFAPTAPLPPPPSEVATAVGRKAQSLEARSTRLLRSGDSVLAVLERDDGWMLWRLPTDPQAAARRLAGAPELKLDRNGQSVYPTFVPCGDNAFLVVIPGAEVKVHRLGPEGQRSWHWSTAAVAQQAAGSGLKISSAPRELDALCFGSYAVVGGFLWRDEGDGRHREGTYAMILSPKEIRRLVLMFPEGGWRVFDMQGHLVHSIDPGTVPGKGRALVRLEDGRWWVLLDEVLAPLDEGRPAVALPLPQGEAATTLDRPWPYANLRPTWSLRSGRPPRLLVKDPSGGESTYLLLVGPAIP